MPLAVTVHPATSDSVPPAPVLIHRGPAGGSNDAGSGYLACSGPLGPGRRKYSLPRCVTAAAGAAGGANRRPEPRVALRVRA